MPGQIWLGHFNIVEGHVQEDGPYAGVFRDRSVSETVADLFLAITSSRTDTDRLCNEVMHTVSRIFGRPQYSLTGNLLLALGTAHQQLRQWNDASLPEHRTGIGVTAVAAANGRAYVAQVGASVAYYWHNGRGQRLEPSEPEARQPLGQSESLSPSFHQLTLTRGDAVLLLSGALANRIDQRTIDRCLAQDAEVGLAELFRMARGERDCGVLLMSVMADPVNDTEPAGSSGAPRSVRPSEPSPRARVQSPDRRPSDIDRNAPLPEPPLDPERPQQRPPSPLRRGLARATNLEPLEWNDGDVRMVGSEGRARSRSAPSTPGNVRPTSSTQIDYGVLRRGLPTLGRRRRISRPIVLGASAVMAVVMVVGISVPLTVNGGRSQRFASLLHSAQSDFHSAQNEVDLGKRRELLNQAQSNLDEAHQLRPDDSQTTSQATSVADALTVMDAVYTLPDVPTLTDLSGAGLSLSSAVEVAAGDNIYVLDVASGKVLSAIRDNSAPPQVVYQDGTQVDGMQTAKAQHIVWQPAADSTSNGALLILDAGRHLFGFGRNGLWSIPLRGVGQWHSDAAMALSLTGGDLYILDAAGATVWRYAPSGTGFDTDPAPTVTRPNIRDASSMSVVSGVFVTGQDGHIHRFLDSQETAFKMPGIDKQPMAPEPPLYDPAGGQLYVADRGNSRIIVLEGDGNFKRQLVHPRLAGLRGDAVDSSNNRLVGVIGQALIAIPLPH